MKKKLLFIFFLLINTEQLSSQIDNSIIITVGNYPITKLDLEKEMKIITVLSKIRINEENKKQIKDLAVQSLVKRSIKKSEIERLKVTQFNKKDVDFQISNISKNLGLEKEDFKIFLQQNNIKYEDISERFEIVLNVIGAQFNSDTFKVNCIKWKEDTEVKSIQEIDIGIMPLHDGPFEKGKCGYKLIQYMACGKPVVASPVGVNKKIVRESNAGYLAITGKDWIEELAKLCDSRALREECGSEARGYIEKYYSVKVILPVFAKLINTLE